jgi:hypothetical protein
MTAHFIGKVLAVHYYNERVKRNPDPGSVRALESAKAQRRALGD